MKIFYFELNGKIKLGLETKGFYFEFDEINNKIKNQSYEKFIYLNPKEFRYEADIIRPLNEIFKEIQKIDKNHIREIDISKINFLPPSPFPSKIICLGLNYLDHAKEVSRPLPKKPNLFSKGTNALVGHKEKIRLPPISNGVDYEGELAIIIGKKGKNVQISEAKNYILGYTIMNDITARDIEFEEDIQWFRSKSFDTFAPMGPFLVIKDDINPNNLDIKLWINNELRQNSSTNRMVFNCYEIISFVSQNTTLYPGDIISTGTPPGIGMKQKPNPKYLKKGDNIKIEIEGIGVLENLVWD